MQVINRESDARIVSFAVCLKKLQYLTERLKVVNDFGVNNVACVSSPRRSALVSLACSHRLPCPRSTRPSTLPPYHERAGPGNKSGLGLGSLSNYIVSGYLVSRFFAPRGQTTTNASLCRSKFVRIPSWSVTIYLCLFVAVEGAVVGVVGEAEEAGEEEEEEVFSSEILGLLSLL